MKRHTLILIIGLMAITAVFGGCTKKKDSSALTDKLAGIKNAAETEQDTSKKKPGKQGEDSQGSGVSAQSLAAAFQNGTIEHNDGWFVRAGNQVFYRVFAKEGVERTSIWGDIAENEADVESEIKYYDLKTGESESIAKTKGKGKLFACADGFLLSAADGQSTVFVPVDGSPDRDFSLGYPEAVSDDGHFVATTLYPVSADWDVTHYVYLDGEEAYRITEGDDDYVTIFGFNGNDLIVMKGVYGEDRYVICSYDENGKCTELGLVEAEADDYCPAPEFEQLLTDGKDIYVMLAYYEGTGHFLYGWDVYRATIGKSGSLQKLQERDTTEEFPDAPPKIYLDDAGKIAYTEHPAGSLGLTEGLAGDLVYYDTPEKSRTLQNFFSSGISEDPYGDVVQEMVAFGETGFALTSRVARDEAEDIGWRMAYDQVELNYIVIPFGIADLDEEGLAKHVTILDQIEFDDDPGQGADGASKDFSEYMDIYAPVLEETRDVVLNFDPDKEYKYMSDGLWEKVNYGDKETIADEIGYLLLDLSGDGVPELMIGYNDDYWTDEAEEQSYVVSIFTIRDGEPYTTMQGWARSSHRWYQDNRFIYNGSGGAMYSMFGLHHISKDGTKVEWDDFYYTDEAEDGGLAVYYNTTGTVDPAASERIRLSEEDFWEMQEEYLGGLLDWTPIGSYR